MQLWPVMKGRKRQRGHGRAKVRAADADIDHIRDLAALPRETAIPHRSRERGHLSPDPPHLAQLFLVHTFRAIAHMAQQRVQHGAVLGLVDLRAGKHRVAPAFNIRRLGHRKQEVPRLARDLGLGEVQEHLVTTDGEGLRPPLILGEQFRDDRPRGRDAFQFVPDCFFHHAAQCTVAFASTVLTGA